MPTPVLTFLGGVGTVTGSKFLLEHGGRRVLVDCGLYQGLAELRRRNRAPFPVDPASIDAVVITHAHLDHIGYLPRLAREGFTGPVWCTAETAELGAIVLRDSAHLQQEDAAYANAAGFSKHDPALPLYDGADVEKSLRLFSPVPFDSRIPLGTGVHAVLRSAGHILGSAIISLDVAGHRVVFSGDLGRPQHPLLLERCDLPPCDTLVVESTYGNRTHPPADPDVLADVVRRTVRRGGVVLIPAFAVDRTELVLLELRRLMRAGEVPAVPVFVDSPMALAALAVYRRALHRGSGQIRADVGGDGDPFDPGDLRLASSAEKSQRLNRPDRACIIVSASGMATGGRVVHHLKHQLPDRRNTVVLTGYQAAGTRGRQLLDGARQIKIHGRYVPVRAEVIGVEHFSVHSDAQETLEWLRRLPKAPGTTYAVHGEPESTRQLVHAIDEQLGWNAVAPTYGEKVRLD